jgi:hypothetical protein
MKAFPIEAPQAKIEAFALQVVKDRWHMPIHLIVHRHFNGEVRWKEIAKWVETSPLFPMAGCLKAKAEYEFIQELRQVLFVDSL